MVTVPDVIVEGLIEVDRHCRPTERVRLNAALALQLAPQRCVECAPDLLE
jgi:hypothetical protein